MALKKVKDPFHHPTPLLFNKAHMGSNPNLPRPHHLLDLGKSEPLRALVTLLIKWDSKSLLPGYRVKTTRITHAKRLTQSALWYFPLYFPCLPHPPP